jgi:uncharacterized protein YndB with AHSA1/START domain
LPRVSRKVELPVGIGSVWEFVSNPGNLPRWWPRVVRVEGVVGRSGTATLSWTSLLEADSGRRVRLDFEATNCDPPVQFSWCQELTGTQFEKHLRRQEYSIRLEGSQDRTVLELVAETDLKGSAKLATLNLRKSQGQVLDRALADLHETLVPRAEQETVPD